MRAGDAFLMRMPGGHESVAHLWFLVTDPDPSTGECVLVNLTTLRAGVDQTVTLRTGDHPFINRPSAVFYAKARIVSSSRIKAAVLDSGEFRQVASCSDDILKLIQDGILASPFTPNSVLTFCRKALNRR